MLPRARTRRFVALSLTCVAGVVLASRARAATRRTVPSPRSPDPAPPPPSPRRRRARRSGATAPRCRGGSGPRRPRVRRDLRRRVLCLINQERARYGRPRPRPRPPPRPRRRPPRRRHGAPSLLRPRLAQRQSPLRAPAPPAGAARSGEAIAWGADSLVDAARDACARGWPARRNSRAVVNDYPAVVERYQPAEGHDRAVGRRSRRARRIRARSRRCSPRSRPGSGGTNQPSDRPGVGGEHPPVARGRRGRGPRASRPSPAPVRSA